MNYQFDSRLGEQLYQLLPEVYRTRDRQLAAKQSGGREDLARYLDAHGHLLDLLHATLEQQLKDTLPLSSQEWLLPYFAQLLAVKILSPTEEGKHAEVANAIPWRQRKGTLKVVEEIAEAIGQIESETQEGWKRVLITPRVGMPLAPAHSVDSSLAVDTRFASSSAKHPSLPVATVDMRYSSRAVESSLSNPATKTTTFAGQTINWRQNHRYGTPCFPGSFDDVSRRTVDLRSTREHRSAYHHKRLQVYMAPQNGLVPFPAIELTWAQRLESKFAHIIEERDENGLRIIRNNAKRRVVINGDVLLPAVPTRIENICFSGELKISDGGTLSLERVEAARVDVPTFMLDENVLEAHDCLMGELSVAGLVTLDSCTVRDEAHLNTVVAVDSIFMQINGSPVRANLKYCRYPNGVNFDSESLIENSTTTEPEFFGGQTQLDARCVLSPESALEITQGASDRGELGGFHNGRQRLVRIQGNNALNIPGSQVYPLQKLILDGDLSVSGALIIERCVIKKAVFYDALSHDDAGLSVPSLIANDSVFAEIDAANTLLRLEYCTVMESIHCRQLQASDCVFAGTVSGPMGGWPESGCIRFSRIPSPLKLLSYGRGANNTDTHLVFSKVDFCNGGNYQRRHAEFAEPGYAVLDESTSQTVRFGAEDGGEMGAHHHQYSSLKIEAMRDKLQEFLPVGIEVALIKDRRLWFLPAEIKNANGGAT